MICTMHCADLSPASDTETSQFPFRSRIGTLAPDVPHICSHVAPHTPASSTPPPSHRPTTTNGGLSHCASEQPPQLATKTVAANTRAERSRNVFIIENPVLNTALRRRLV